MNLPNWFHKFSCIFLFPYSSRLLVLAFLCRLDVHCFLFVLYLQPLAFMLIFLLSIITISQRRKQALSILPWSLIIVNQNKQHVPNVVGVCDLANLRVKCGRGFDCRKGVGCVSKVLNEFFANKIIQCMKLILWSCQHGYQIKRLFTCTEIS